MTKHPRWWLAVIATAVAAYALVVVLSPIGEERYQGTALHAAIETAAALMSLLAAHLLYGRFRRTGERRDLAVATALAIFAAANLTFSAIPASIQDRSDAFSVWAPLAGRLLAALVLAVAAFLPSRKEPDRNRAAAVWLGAMALGLLAILLTVRGIQDSLPQPFATTGQHRNKVLGAELALMALFFVAATGFGRRARQSASILLLCITIASFLAALSCLNAVIHPSEYGEWFVSADLLRLGVFAVLVGGGVVDRRDALHDIEVAAVLDERRRIARELHDGVAQDLAFIVQQGNFLGRRAGAPEGLKDIVRAAQRALDDSRDAIAALVRPNDEPLADTLERAAEQVARREGTTVEVQVAPRVAVEPETREALLRIMREAVTNAARHGKAGVVRVTCSAGPQLRMLIHDDGTGFDPEAVAVANGHYGISGMRERVERLGGAFRMQSEPGRGTEVEVVLP